MSHVKMASPATCTKVISRIRAVKTQLKHHSALIRETTMALAAVDLPQEIILGPLCTRKELSIWLAGLV